MTYTASIETNAGTYQHGFHLGTIEGTARDLCEEIFFHRKPKQGERIVTVALKLEGKMVDVFDGEWFNDCCMY